jgi:hypothetical protein
VAGLRELVAILPADDEALLDTCAVGWAVPTRRPASVGLH